MTETIEPMAAQIDQQKLAKELVEKARAEGVELAGPGGMLTGLTKSVLEAALEAEMTEHVGYDKHDPGGRNGLRHMDQDERSAVHDHLQRSGQGGA